jgi:RNA polymerase sigma-70 factor (ECF subfamily)
MPEPPTVSGDVSLATIRALQCGDDRAHGRFERQFGAALRAFCRRYVRRDEDVEDALQDILCKVLRAPSPPRNVRAWLYAIARNHCLNLIRARGRRKDAQQLPSDAVIATGRTGHLTRLVRREMQSRVGRDAAALPKENGDALRLRYVEGLSRAEIAERLGIPESVVKSRLFEGLQKLRRATGLADGV